MGPGGNSRHSTVGKCMGKEKKLRQNQRKPRADERFVIFRLEGAGEVIDWYGGCKTGWSSEMAADKGTCHQP